jgi:hypothetical protein
VVVIDSTIDGNDAGMTGTANPGNGGGIHVTGTSFTRVDLRGSVVSNNRAAREGGGLWNQTDGVMIVRLGTQVTGNTAYGDAADDGGGGIFNHGGRLVINNASIDHNRADGAAGSGGGIFTRDGVTTVESASVRNNAANGNGGGIEIVDGWLAMSQMELVGNEADNGGGLHVSGSHLTRVTLGRTTILGNRAVYQGGGLWHQSGSILVLNPGTRVALNGASGDGPNEGGGGLFNNGGRVAITGTVIDNNWADGSNASGGGILSLGGGVTLDNSTVSGNDATGDGGGIVNNGTLITANATIAVNCSDAEDDGTGTGGGIRNNGVATLRNTIVAGNDTGKANGGGLSPNDVAGNALTPNSSSNLVSDPATAGGLIDGVNGNIIGDGGTGVLPLPTILDPNLINNGGPTLTHALATGSPAIDAGNNTFASSISGIPFVTDQRGVGFPRINNGTVDLGAFEA